MESEATWLYACGFSINMAMPWPPPMQAEATPKRLPLRRSWYMRVSTRRVPVAPRGNDVLHKVDW